MSIDQRYRNMTPKYSIIDEYIANFPPETQEIFGTN